MPQSDRYRLRLDAISESNCSEETLPPYTFTYDTERDMPRRWSLARDAWGYYNGADDNTGLLPDISNYCVLGLQGNADRDTRFAWMKSWILKEIEYPLGGKNIFEFEANTQGGNIQEVGGLRIKKITRKDITSGHEIAKGYVYSNGILYGGALPYFIEDPGSNPRSYQVPPLAIRIVASTRQPYYTTQGYHIGYSAVTVINSDGGKSTYRYNNILPTFYSYFPNPPMQYTIGSGNLNREELLNNLDAEVAKTNFTYDTIGTYRLKARRVASTSCASPSQCNQGCENEVTAFCCFYPNEYILWADYEITTARSRLISKEESLDGVTKLTTYEYDPYNRHGNAIKETFVNSDQKENVKIIHYAHNSNFGPLSMMAGKNMIGIPLEVLNYVDNHLVGGGRTEYADIDGMLLPHKFYRIEDDNGQLEENTDFVLKGTVEYSTSGSDRGYPIEYQKADYDQPIYFSWKNGLLTQKQYQSRYWQYEYYPGTTQIKSKKDYNDQYAEYEYDDFWRLKKTKTRPDNVSDPHNFNIQTGYDYVYRESNLPRSYVQTTTTFSDAPTSSVRQYVDGLGRPIEQIQVNHSPAGKDVITATEYNDQGQVWRNYLPFEGGNDGAFTVPTSPYSALTYECSPLGRVIMEKLPGFGEKNYLFGTNGNDVKDFANDGMYLSGELYKNVAVDENGNPTENYTDKSGKSILTRKFVEDALNPGGNNGNIVDTYRVYEDNGDLKAVVPPLASGVDDELFGYQYLYDSRHRLIQKSLPGAGTTRYTFDDRDRLTDVQDALGRHIHTEYDTYDRLLSNTLTNTGETLTQMQYAGVTDFVTHKNVTVLDPDNSGQVLHHAYTLDSWGRVTLVLSNNYEQGNDALATAYNHADQILSTELDHTGFGQPSLEIKLGNLYDNGHRLTDISQNISGGGLTALGGVHVVHQGYNYRDELIQKLLNENPSGAPFDYLQSVDYQYNSRGFLTKINQIGLTGDNLPFARICSTETPTGGTACTERSCIKQSIREVKISVGVDKDKLNEMGFGWVHYRFEARAQPLESDSSYDVTTDTLLGAGVVNGLPDSVFGTVIQIELDTTTNVHDSLSKAAAMQTVQTQLSQQLLQAGVQSQQTAGLVTQSVMQALALDFVVPTSGPPVITLDDNDLFAEQLFYASSNSTLQAPAQFNGNISMVKWQTQGRNIQAYGYSYDQLNRLKSATYADLFSTTSGCVYSSDDRYTLNGLRYDHHGNIRMLQRHGLKLSEDKPCYTPKIIDYLRYTYIGNQVQAIQDYADDQTGFIDGANAETEYTYDAAGNLTSDLNKGILSIEYNYLNLPQKIVFSQNREIHFVYTAEGQKLRKTTYVDGQKVATRDYAAGMEYLDQSLDFIGQPEGRVLVMPGKKLRYEYALRDHLGDTRITFSDLNQNGLIEKSKGEIIQENHYDPFGMELTGIWQKQWDAHHETAYRYNGKEFNADFGLNWSDYGARWYDATDGRWWVLDPMAEKSRRWSPYCYGLDNSVRFIDPDGNSAQDHIVVNNKGHIIAHNGDPKVHMVTIVNTDSDKQQIFADAVKKGITYDIGGVMRFGKNVNGHYYHGAPPLTDRSGRILKKVPLERAIPLYPKGGIVQVGNIKEEVIGDSPVHIPKEEIDKVRNNDQVGFAHTEPINKKNSPIMVSYDGGTHSQNYSPSPSGFDYKYYSPKSGYFSIIDRPDEVVFFNGKQNDIIIQKDKIK